VRLLFVTTRSGGFFTTELGGPAPATRGREEAPGGLYGADGSPQPGGDGALRVLGAHEYRPLGTDELTSVVSDHWQDLGLRVASGEFTDPEAVEAARASLIIGPP
jgi:hypothetical protein